jgi:putative YhdH/YhfP family quinone oxidoreductase
VGSIAVGILAKAGYRVVAATGKTGEKAFLLNLGAEEVLHRDEVDDASGRPLMKERWAGVVDTVGANILATAVKSTRYGGVVTCCGLTASPELHTTVYPFILRGVSLLGVDSAECPMEMRLEIWKRLAGEWKLDRLEDLASECALEELEGRIEAMLKGKSRGRMVVNLRR